MEAQSQGLACVATDVSAIRELIQDGINGLLAPAERAQEFAQALQRLMTDPQLRRSMGEAGRQRVQSEFGLHRNIERLAQKFGLRAEH